ncbi:MAG: IS66 family transposase [Steroidobacteraceae bacterium]
MVGLLKYGTWLPFNRIETLQTAMRIPLPATTQWNLVKNGAGPLSPAHEELIREGAQGSVLHNDDTTMKVLELTREQRAAALAADVTEERTGGVYFRDRRHGCGAQDRAVLHRRAARRCESRCGARETRSRASRPDPDVR